MTYYKTAQEAANAAELMRENLGIKELERAAARQNKIIKALVESARRGDDLVLIDALDHI